MNYGEKNIYILMDWWIGVCLEVALHIELVCTSNKFLLPLVKSIACISLFPIVLDFLATIEDSGVV